LKVYGRRHRESTPWHRRPRGGSGGRPRPSVAPVARIGIPPSSADAPARRAEGALSSELICAAARRGTLDRALGEPLHSRAGARSMLSSEMTNSPELLELLTLTLQRTEAVSTGVEESGVQDEVLLERAREVANECLKA